MTGELVSHDTFRWIMTALTIAGSVWVLYDVLRLVKLRGADPRDPIVRDKRFGYAIGIVIGVFAVVGVLRFHGVL